MTAPDNTGAPERWAIGFDTWLTSRFVWCIGLSALSCVLTFCGYSHAKVPWVDEVLQTIIARLDGPREIWRALMDSIQIDPPVLHIVQHYLLRIFGDHVLLMRLPSIIGFTTMCVALAMLVRRYAPPVYAWAAFFLPYATMLRSRASDARPYGVLMGFSALTMICWDSISKDRNHQTAWRVCLAICIAGTISMHFYGILIFLPLAAGEAAKWILRRRPDPMTWLCACIGAAPFIFWFPILRNATVRYAKTHHYKVAFSNLYGFFGDMVASLPIAGVLLALVIAVAIGGRSVVESRPAQDLPDRFKALLAAAAGFLIIPLAAYVGGILTTGLFIPYHLMVSIFGVVIGLPLVLSAMSNRSRLVGFCLFAAIAGHGLFVTMRGLSGFFRRDSFYPSLAAVRKLIPAAHPDVVVPSPLHFLPFYNATSADPENNLVYIYDAPKALAEQQTDIADLMLPKLHGRTEARIEPLDGFLGQHETFYMAVLGETLGVQEWQFGYLLKKVQARFRWLGKVGDFDIYEVSHGPLAFGPAEKVNTPAAQGAEPTRPNHNGTKTAAIE